MKLILQRSLHNMFSAAIANIYTLLRHGTLFLWTNLPKISCLNSTESRESRTITFLYLSYLKSIIKLLFYALYISLYHSANFKLASKNINITILHLNLNFCQIKINILNFSITMIALSEVISFHRIRKQFSRFLNLFIYIFKEVVIWVVWAFR